MKRLIKKQERVAFQKPLRNKRLMRKKILADMVPVEPTDPNAVQYTTDVMATGGQIQIEYNGEWKTISPYGWNTSEAGNVLLMCYKDTGEVRSYRLDRITQFLFDDTQVMMNEDMSMDNQEESNEFQTGDTTTTVDDWGTSSEDEIPDLPDDEFSTAPGEFDVQQPQQEMPFDEALDTLDAGDEWSVAPEENQEENLEETEENNEFNTEIQQEDPQQQQQL